MLEYITESFFYNNLLHQKDYVKKLLLWLNSFQKIGWFKCVELDELEGGGKEIINNKYMKVPRQDYRQKLVNLVYQSLHYARYIAVA